MTVKILIVGLCILNVALGDQLVGWWFSDGTAVDRTEHGYDVTIAPPVRYVSNEWFGGTTAQPLQFPFVDPSVYLPYQKSDVKAIISPVPWATSETITSYVKAAGTDGFIFSFGNANTDDLMGLWVTSGQLQYYLYDGNNTCSWQTSGLSLNNDQWHHVAMVHNETASAVSDQVKMYVNGLEVTVIVVSPPGTFCNVAPVTNMTTAGSKGGAAGYSSPFVGYMYDLRYYDYALTSDNIHTLITQTPTLTASGTPTHSGTATPTITPSSSVTASPTQTPTTSSSSSGTSTATSSPTPSSTVTPTNLPTMTQTQSESETDSSSETPTPTVTDSQTSTPSLSTTQTPSLTISLTDSISETDSTSTTSSPSATPSPSSSATQSSSVSATSTPLPTHSPSITASDTPTSSPSFSITVSPSSTHSITGSLTDTPTPSETMSPTETLTPTETGTQTATTTPSQSTTSTGSQTKTGGCVPYSTSCYLCDNGIPCDDGNALTLDDKCFNGKCLGAVMDDTLKTADGFRHFTVDISALSNDPILSDVVWVKYDRDVLPKSGEEITLFFKEGTGASKSLRRLAEDGQTEMMAAEMSVLKAQNVIKDYGVVTSHSDMYTSSYSVGQKWNFQVTASQHEFFTFITMLKRSNDRFLAPPLWAIPFFDGLTPNYGDQTSHLVLWDAGTEVNQPYFANLHLGLMQSNQPGGVTGGIEELGLVARVAPWEFLSTAPNNDTYPTPRQIVRVSLLPGLTTTLSDRTRGSSNVVAQIGFTLDKLKPLGNEFRVAFPSGFRFVDGTVSNVTWKPDLRHLKGRNVVFEDIAYGQPVTVADPANRTVRLIWPQGTVITPKTNEALSILISGIILPNNCETGDYTINTYQCEDVDLHGQGAWTVRKCTGPLFSATSRASSGVAADCTICNACLFVASNPATGMSTFECEHGGKKFLRDRPMGDASFSNFLGSGPSNGQCTPY